MRYMVSTHLWTRFGLVRITKSERFTINNYEFRAANIAILPKKKNWACDSASVDYTEYQVAFFIQNFW